MRNCEERTWRDLEWGFWEEFGDGWVHDEAENLDNREVCLGFLAGVLLRSFLRSALLLYTLLVSWEKVHDLA
jgi:hypothetical protein